MFGEVQCNHSGPRRVPRPRPLNLRISCISAFLTVCNRNHGLWLQDGLIRVTTVKNGTGPGRVQLLEHVPDAFQTRLLLNGHASSNCGRAPFMEDALATLEHVLIHGRVH